MKLEAMCCSYKPKSECGRQRITALLLSVAVVCLSCSISAGSNNPLLSADRLHLKLQVMAEARQLAVIIWKECYC